MSAVQPPWSPEVADPDPITQFSRWFADALDVREPEPEAMTLATASPDGVPTLRWVLLKSWDDRGFVFYSNEHSAKGADMAANPVAALAWRWYHLERQVRAVGAVTAVDPEQSDRYFASRPRGAQIGAWASEQSSVVANRAFLEARMTELANRFEGGEVTRPPHWRGFRVQPTTLEFWQGRRDRVHDRVVYRDPTTTDPTSTDGGWVRERLAP
ncbi:MAG: pyridoxamine 5'-phosphate oxidase [Actinomycetota bacterium]|nr:pyridoxamine 5'-phosphate oxidase [Actinomycetota bacterium]